MTTGDEINSFSETGINHFTFQELARPIQQTALFCGMKWLDPFVVYHASQLSENELFQAGERYRDRLVWEVALKKN